MEFIFGKVSAGYNTNLNVINNDKEKYNLNFIAEGSMSAIAIKEKTKLNNDNYIENEMDILSVDGSAKLSAGFNDKNEASFYEETGGIASILKMSSEQKIDDIKVKESLYIGGVGSKKGIGIENGKLKNKGEAADLIGGGYEITTDIKKK